MKNLVLFLAMLWAGTGASFAQENETVRIAKEIFAREQETHRTAAAESDTVEIGLIEPETGELGAGGAIKYDIKLDGRQCACIDSQEVYERGFKEHKAYFGVLPEIDFSQNTLIDYHSNIIQNSLPVHYWYWVRKMYKVKENFVLRCYRQCTSPDGGILDLCVAVHAVKLMLTSEKIDCAKYLYEIDQSCLYP